MNTSGGGELRSPRKAAGTGPSVGVGSMTAVMRTLAVSAGPRIPRVAVVRGGRILDEHLFRDGRGVTIGSDEAAAIVVRGAPLPPSFELLERIGDTYWLRFTPAMTGRVTGPDGIHSLDELRRTTARVGTESEIWRVPLTSDARGKIVVGDTTFLFQIVPSPPVSPRPRLPLGVLTGVGLDWSLTIIAAFSFLVHFGIAGAIYSDWMDPVVGTDRTVSALVDDLARLPKPPPEVLPTTPEISNTTLPPEAKTPVASRTTTPTSPGTRAPGSARSTNANASASDRNAAALVAKAEQMELDLLAARASGSSVDATLNRREIPIVDLSAAAAKNTGVTTDNPNGLRVATGGPIEGHRGTSLPGLAGPTRRTGTDSAGTETAANGPSLRVDTQPALTTGTISDADRVIASLRPRFRKCYQDGLAVTPSMSGKAILAAKVAPNGEVSSVEVASNDGLSPQVTSCLSRVLQNAQFTGNGSMGTLRVPVSLVQQK